MKILRWLLLLLILAACFFSYQTYETYQSILKENETVLAEIGEKKQLLEEEKAEVLTLQKEYESLVASHQENRGEYDVWAKRIEALREKLPH